MANNLTKAIIVLKIVLVQPLIACALALMCTLHMSMYNLQLLSTLHSKHRQGWKSWQQTFSVPVLKQI